MNSARSLAVIGATVVAAGAAVAIAASTARAQGPDTEIWVAPLDVASGRFTIGTPVNISRAPGYDNHPWFLGDGSGLYFVSGRGSGGQYDVYRYDFARDATTRITNSPGNDYSPKPAANGTLTLLHEEPAIGTRLWHYGADGKPIGLLASADHLGYYARIDEHTVAFYVNEPKRGFLIEDLRTHSITRVGEGIRGQPALVPGQRAVTVLRDDSAGVTWVERYDVGAGRFTRLVKAVPGVGWHLWSPRGTIIQTSGNRILEWDPAKGGDWTVAWTFAEPELQGITRVVFSPTGDRIAIVSAPSDEQAIRNARQLSNEALAAHDTAGFARSLRADVRVVSGTGLVRDSRTAYVASIAEQVAQFPDAVYVRTPTTIERSADRTLAAEQGTWTGNWTTPTGPVAVRGSYFAQWQREGGGAWLLRAELFVRLTCDGAGCVIR